MADAARPVPQLPRSPHSERVALNLSWLLKLRWAAVLGQLVTILAVAWPLGIELPLVALAVLLAVEAASNATLDLWFRRVVARGTWDRWAAHGEALLGSVMVLDVVLLTGLICVTGGSTNPFSVFYLVNVVLAAVVLRPVWGWRLGALATACYAAFFLGHRSLPALEITESTSPVQAARAWALHKSGMFVAFATATVIVVYFFTRLTREINRLEDELVEARARKARSERIEALGTLAAGAAHELSSPLSTIAVVARELERELQVPGQLDHAAADARLIRSEVARCRAILDQMSAEAGQSAGESPQSLTVEDLVSTILDRVEESERARVRVQVGDDLAAVRLVQPRQALAQALRGLVKNALDASRPGQSVRLVASRAGSQLRVEVQDDGAGMDPATLQRAGDPFFTTKEPGRGMGLGLFLARSVAERLGGSLAIDSVRGLGTTVRVLLPLPAANGSRAT